MRAKVAERARARELRRQGLTYDRIAAELGVSKASISLWTRDLPKPPPSPEGIARRVAAHKLAFARRRAATALVRQEEKQRWTEQIGCLSDREVLIAGAVAYWAEGTKAKPWRTEEIVSFINSDPDMIRLWLRYLRLCGVSASQLRFHVCIHETADVEAARDYWSAETGVPVEAFGRPRLKRAPIRTVRKNVGDSYHGCLTVRVCQGASLYRRIEGTWWAVAQAVAT